jgi:hypothetical protein
LARQDVVRQGAGRDDEKTIRLSPALRRTVALIVLSALVGVIWAWTEIGFDRPSPGTSGVVATGGAPTPAAERGTERAEGQSVPLGGRALDRVDELTALGMGDGGRQLVGRRLSLLVDIPASATPVFWVGRGDHRLLAVVSRDTRTAPATSEGTRSHIDDDDLDSRRAVLTGVIETLPHAEAMYSWNLTESDRSALRKRPIYFRVDSVDSAPAVN